MVGKRTHSGGGSTGRGQVRVATISLSHKAEVISEPIRYGNLIVKPHRGQQPDRAWLGVNRGPGESLVAGEPPDRTILVEWVPQLKYVGGEKY